jgi:hypothetical protein
LQSLTAHSLSRRVRGALAGDLGAHRHLPVDRGKDSEPEKPKPVPTPGGGYTASETWNRHGIVGWPIFNLWTTSHRNIADVDQRADELNRRPAALVSGDSTQ